MSASRSAMAKIPTGPAAVAAAPVPAAIRGAISAAIASEAATFAGPGTRRPPSAGTTASAGPMRAKTSAPTISV